VLDALEARYPALAGPSATTTARRRAFIRFFACEQELSTSRRTLRCAEAVASGAEPYLIVGAMGGWLDQAAVAVVAVGMVV